MLILCILTAQANWKCSLIFVHCDFQASFFCPLKMGPLFLVKSIGSSQTTSTGNTPTRPQSSTIPKVLYFFAYHGGPSGLEMKKVCSFSYFVALELFPLVSVIRSRESLPSLTWERNNLIQSGNRICKRLNMGPESSKNDLGNRTAPDSQYRKHLFISL